MLIQKNIIKILCLQLAMLMVLQNTKAQTLIEFKKMQSAEKAKLVADSLRTILHLGDQQYTKLYDILLEGAVKAQPIVKSDCNKISKGYKLKSLLSQQEAKLEAILTKYQYQLYQKKKEELIAKFKSNKENSKLLFDKM